MGKGKLWRALFPFIFGSVFAVIVMKVIDQDSGDVVGPEQPQAEVLRDLYSFADEDLKQRQDSSRELSDEVMEQHAIALYGWLWRKPLDGFTRSAFVSGRGSEELRVIVGDDNGLMGGGIQFAFSSKTGRLLEIRLGSSY